MAGTVRITVKGDKELMRRLRALPGATAGLYLNKAISAGAELVALEASQRAPRRTGRLASHIDVDLVKEGGLSAEVAVGPGKPAWYGIFPEIGTKQAPAQPYLRPALDESKGDVERAISGVLRQSLMRAIV